MPHEALDIEDLLGLQHVVEGAAELVGQCRQGFGLAELRRQPLEQRADALVLLGTGSLFHYWGAATLTIELSSEFPGDFVYKCHPTYVATLIMEQTLRTAASEK